MNTFNEVTGIFCLGRDPEVKYTPSGVAVASFSGASNHSYKKGDEWEQETEWTNFTVWSKQAERVGEMLHKGSLVYIAGRLKTEKWEDKEGNTRYSTKVIVRKIEFLANYNKPEGGYQPKDEDVPGGYGQGPGTASSSADDDIPF